MALLFVPAIHTTGLGMQDVALSQWCAARGLGKICVSRRHTGALPNLWDGKLQQMLGCDPHVARDERVLFTTVGLVELLGDSIADKYASSKLHVCEPVMFYRLAYLAMH